MSLIGDPVGTLLRLPAPSLTEIGRALSDGVLRYGFSTQALTPFCGPIAAETNDSLQTLAKNGMSLATLGLFCVSLGRALAERDMVERSVELILTGPEVAGAPVVDTRTTVLSLFDEATEEVLISSYVFYEAAEFFRRVAEKHDTIPNFRVMFLVDLSHRRDSSNLPSTLITQIFTSDFRTKHWPGQRLPEVWHDPRCFAADNVATGVMHAKTVIIDRKTVFITSANFTGAGQSRNIEAGVLIRYPRTAKRLHGYFSGLMRLNVLRRIL